MDPPRRTPPAPAPTAFCLPRKPHVGSSTTSCAMQTPFVAGVQHLLRDAEPPVHGRTRPSVPRRTPYSSVFVTFCITQNPLCVRDHRLLRPADPPVRPCSSPAARRRRSWARVIAPSAWCRRSWASVIIAFCVTQTVVCGGADPLLPPQSAAPTAPSPVDVDADVDVDDPSPAAAAPAPADPLRGLWPGAARERASSSSARHGRVIP
jgi:hypothetical protein